MDNVLLMHDCSIADICICDQSIASFSTAAMHFPNAYKLIKVTGYPINNFVGALFIVLF